MTTNLIYRYPPLIPGILLRRYKRFFAEIELESQEIIIAHCPNTGKMTGVCKPGSLVQVSRSDNPKRKLAYTWEMIQVHDTKPTWVGVNTNLPNRVVKLALEKHLFPQLGQYQQIYSEVKIGQQKQSRIDFMLTGGDRPIYIEVKSATLSQGTKALFPDTVSTRGQKHIEELTSLLPEVKAVMLYFINRGDCTSFSSGDRQDPVYGQLLRKGYQQGLIILPCRFAIYPEGISYLGIADFGFESL